MNIPGYKIDHILGQGGMATVYLALQESLRRKVAFKVMSPELAAEEDFTQRFIKEGRIVAQLSHPHIVTIYDIGNYGPYNYMAMEYVNAGTFKERIKQSLPIENGLRVIKEIGEALSAAHAMGIIHRDIKPANILFRSNGTSVLTDFGIAKGGGSNMAHTAAGVAMGTPHYMSPEQAKGEGVSPQSDFYSLGVVLYELLTGGKKPFGGSDHFSIAIKHIQDPIPTLPVQLEPYQALLNRLLAKHPAERVKDGKELSKLINGLLQSSLMDITAVAPGVGKEALPEAALHEKLDITQKTEPRKTTSTQRKSNTKKAIRWRFVSAMLTLLVAVGVTAYTLFWHRTPAEYLPFPVAAAYTLTEEKKESVANQLETAEFYVGLPARIAGGTGTAEDAYKGVLALDPNNTIAQQGMVLVADTYLQRTQKFLDIGDPETGLKQVEEGLASLKDFSNLTPKLHALKEKIQQDDMVTFF